MIPKTQLSDIYDILDTFNTDVGHIDYISLDDLTIGGLPHSVAMAVMEAITSVELPDDDDAACKAAKHAVFRRATNR
jgi:hypothetical protein